jgi:hypothetical protein
MSGSATSILSRGFGRSSGVAALAAATAARSFDDANRGDSGLLRWSMFWIIIYPPDGTGYYFPRRRGRAPSSTTTAWIFGPLEARVGRGLASEYRVCCVCRVVLARLGVFDMSSRRQSCRPGQKLIIFNGAGQQGRTGRKGRAHVFVRRGYHVVGRMESLRVFVWGVRGFLLLFFACQLHPAHFQSGVSGHRLRCGLPTPFRIQTHICDPLWTSKAKALSLPFFRRMDNDAHTDNPAAPASIECRMQNADGMSHQAPAQAAYGTQILKLGHCSGPAAQSRLWNHSPGNRSQIAPRTPPSRLPGDRHRDGR